MSDIATTATTALTGSNGITVMGNKRHWFGEVTLSTAAGTDSVATPLGVVEYVSGSIVGGSSVATIIANFEQSTGGIALVHHTSMGTAVSAHIHAVGR